MVHLIWTERTDLDRSQVLKQLVNIQANSKQILSNSTFESSPCLIFKQSLFTLSFSSNEQKVNQNESV